MKIFTDGVFDLFHYGHANALRQAKLLGDYLVVGVNSNESCRLFKNNPVLNELERTTVLESCKWIDEIIPNFPYFLDYEIIKKHNIDFVVHGDDEIVDVNGNHCYKDAVSDNKYKQFERTNGISTSDLVGRLLYREEYRKTQSRENDIIHKRLFDLFQTEERIKTGHIIYVDGSFDLYHAGHASIIKEAASRGDYLLIGLHSDSEIVNFKGESPIMTKNERILNLMSNRWVDRIITDAPYLPNIEFINTYGINEIYCGAKGAGFYDNICDAVKITPFENEFGYMNSNLICQRIIDNHIEYRNKIKK